MRLQCRHQVLEVEGLADVVVHAGGKTRFAVGRHCVGRHCDDGQLRRAEALADFGGGAVAVHHRHLDVHQHDIEAGPLAQRRVHAFAPVVGERDGGAFAAQQFVGHLSVDGVVFHHEDAQAGEPSRAADDRAARKMRPTGIGEKEMKLFYG